MSIIPPNARCQIDIEDLVPLMQRDDPLKEPYHDERNAVGSCSCEHCRGACRATPGFFDPLGFLHYITSKIVGEFDQETLVGQFELELDNLQLDFYFQGDNNNKIYMLRPRTLDEEPGKLVRMDFLKSDCVFLGTPGTDEKVGCQGCQLNERQRPMECRTAYGCGKAKFDGSKGVMKDHWNTPLGKAIIALYTKLGIAKYGKSFQKRATDDFRGEMTLAMERQGRDHDMRKLVKAIAQIRFEETGVKQTSSDLENIGMNLIIEQMRIMQQTMGGGIRTKT